MGPNGLRLLYIQPAVNVGGAERQASVLLPHLGHEGIEPTLLVGPGRDVVPWFESAGFSSLVWSPHFPDAPFSFRRLGSQLATLHRLVRDADALFGAHRFDVVVGSLAYGWAASGLIAQRWDVPSIWRAGGLTSVVTSRWVEDSAARGFAYWLRPAACVCNSSAVRDRWASAIGVPTFVVPNAIEPMMTAPRHTAHAGFKVGFLGRISPEKGLPLLVRAVAIAREAGRDVRLMIGGPGDLEALRRIADAAGIGPWCSVLGPVQDVAHFFAACDVLAVPSRSEGSPNVALEAAMHDVPCVATAVGGTPELLRHGIDALLVPPDDPPALARALLRLADEPALGRQLARSAHGRLERHKPEAAARSFARIVRAVTAPRLSTDDRSPFPSTPA